MNEELAFIDVETTGLDETIHEICEIAVLINGFSYHKKVQILHPDKADPIALKINGYCIQDWKDALHPKIIAGDLYNLLKGKTIVAHNPSFDIAFIVELLHQYGYEAPFRRRAIDTITLAHEHLQPCGLDSLSMDSIRSCLGWSLQGAHTAIKDAQDVESLYRLLSRSSMFRRLLWRWKYKLLKLLKLLF